MIRINLLGVERTRARKAITFDIGQRLTLAAGVIVAVAVLGIGWWYWTLSRESAQLDADLAAAQQEATRLRSLLTEVSSSRRNASSCGSASRSSPSFAADRTSPCSCSTTSAGAFPTCSGSLPWSRKRGR